MNTDKNCEKCEGTGWTRIYKDCLCLDKRGTNHPHTDIPCPSCSTTENKEVYTLDNAIRDICSVSVTAAPKSKIRAILERLLASQKPKTL